MGKASRRRMASRDPRRPSRVARRTRALESSVPFVARPFEGLSGETEWVALREILPAATAVAALAGGGTVTLATVLPLAWAGLHRSDGEVLLGLQGGGSSGDPSRDLAATLLAVQEAEPGERVALPPAVTAESPRLQDLLDAAQPFTATVHDRFDFWLGKDDELDEEASASLRQANETVVPTVRLEAATSAYWCRIGERTHLRWVLPHDEDAATDALARLHAAAASALGQHSRLLGAFRACGLLVPVWDLDPSRDPNSYEGPVADLASRLEEALAAGSDLSGDERRARAGLLTRQITLR